MVSSEYVGFISFAIRICAKLVGKYFNVFSSLCVTFKQQLGLNYLFNFVLIMSLGYMPTYQPEIPDIYIKVMNNVNNYVMSEYCRSMFNKLSLN